MTQNLFIQPAAKGLFIIMSALSSNPHSQFSYTRHMTDCQ